MNNFLVVAMIYMIMFAVFIFVMGCIILGILIAYNCIMDELPKRKNKEDKKNGTRL